LMLLMSWCWTKDIHKKCDHPVFQKGLTQVVRIKKTTAHEKPEKKRVCDHLSFDLGLLCHANPEVNPGWCAARKFLFGVECAGCGSPFVQKALQAQDSGDKERGAPQILSRANPACCCINLHDQTGTGGKGCGHAHCKHCWDEGSLRHPRLSRHPRLG
jgi:hypothetical protein